MATIRVQELESREQAVKSSYGRQLVWQSLVPGGLSAGKNGGRVGAGAWQQRLLRTSQTAPKRSAGNTSQIRYPLQTLYTRSTGGSQRNLPIGAANGGALSLAQLAS